MKSLSEQITELQLEIATLKRAAGRLKKLEAELQKEQAVFAKLERKIDNEYRRILALKKKKWIDLFLDREEDKAERLEKENQAYYDAVVQLKKSEKALKLIEFEIEILQGKASKLSEKELLLQKLKFKQKHTIELSVKKESDKAIVIKNRLQNIFHKIIRSGQNIQVHLEEVRSALNKIETWQNYNLSDPEKQKISKEEFEKIKNILHKQNLELLKYDFELEKLKKLESDLNSKELKDVEKIWSDGKKLKGKLELFADIILNNLSVGQSLQNELIKLKAKIVEIQYGIDQMIKLLQV